MMFKGGGGKCLKTRDLTHLWKKESGWRRGTREQGGGSSCPEHQKVVEKRGGWGRVRPRSEAQQSLEVRMQA